MRLNSIESVLSSLGYEYGEIKNLSINDSEDGINISFRVIKCDISEDNEHRSTRLHKEVIKKEILDVPKEPPKKEEPHYEEFGEYCKRLNEEMARERKRESVKDVKNVKVKPTELASHVVKPRGSLANRPDVKKKIKDDYQESTNRRVWKTTVPQTRIRFVYFKSRADVDAFVSNYKSEFEIPLYTQKDEEVIPYVIKTNTTENELYEAGYKWLLSFHMNGADFEVLENCESLKKRKNKSRGGQCIRYKE